MAAHFAYVSSGALFGRSKISLIGALDEIVVKPSDKNLPPSGPLNQSILTQNNQTTVPPQYAKKYMTDVRNMFALKLTEIFEWSLEKGLESLNTPAKQSSSLANMLGLSGGNNNNSESDKSKISNLLLIRPSSESILKSKIYLCSYKFRFALILSDLGLVSEALEYAIDVKNFIHYVTSKVDSNDSNNKNSKSKLPPVSSKPTSNSNPNSNTGSAECSTPIKQQPFSRGFINTVHEFIDRLSGGNSKNNSNGSQGNNNSNSSSTSSSTTSTWNVWNMFNSANLKDLVDGSNVDQPLPPPQQQQQQQQQSNQNKLAPPPLNTNSNSKPPIQPKDLPPPPPTIPTYSMNQPPQNLPPPPTIPGVSSIPPPSTTTHHLKSSSSTGDLKDIPISDEIPFDSKSVANRHHSYSNPPSNSGIASQPNHKKQHSFDLSTSNSSLSSLSVSSSSTSSIPEKTSPTKVASSTTTTTSKKESENTIVASVSFSENYYYVIIIMMLLLLLCYYFE